MDSLTSQLGGLSVSKSSAPSSLIVYLLAKNGNHACYFHGSSDKFLMSRCLSVPDSFEPGQLYLLEYSSGGVKFSNLSERTKREYVERSSLAFTDRRYKTRVLRGLLLGCRIRDYEQSCATVVNVTPLIIVMPNRPGFLTQVQFFTETGHPLTVRVDDVNREGDKKSMKLFCTPLTSPLPSSIVKDARLELVDNTAWIPTVTTALEAVYKGTRAITKRKLLTRIYGAPGVVAHSRIELSRITIQKEGGDVILNAEQSEAIQRYLAPRRDCPTFAVESPPGSGKTMTAAAMAVSYKEPGLQLFLSTANVPVFNMAFALAAIDYGEMKIRHLVSAAVESMQKPHERSPFSIAEKDEELKVLRQLLETATGREKKEIRTRLYRAQALALLADGDYDVILATVDMVLGKLLKPKDPTKPACPIQSQLETRVRRIVIDEASQMTEAALNGIIICFPRAKIVLIGDSKQLPPYKFTAGDVVSELAARSALEVLTRARNVPVITLRRVYRAAPSRMLHYSDVFYGGRLISGKPESTRVQLISICRGVTNRLLFIDVAGSKAEQSGTSKVNDKEIAALESVVGRLRSAGYDHESVMVIAYYEAQRKLAKTRLPDGYEVLTVDSAQGREKDIVIVLTTRHSKTDAAFFTCPLRCNVATSRHKEALIILGSAALRVTEPWMQLFKEKKYFQEVSYGSK